MYGAGAAYFCLEPESAPGPQTSGAGAAQKSGGSATLSSGSTPPFPRKNLLCGTAGNIVLLHIIVIDLSYRVFKMFKHTCLLARAVLPDR